MSARIGSYWTGRAPGGSDAMGDAGHEEIMVHAGLAEVCMAVDDIPKI